MTDRYPSCARCGHARQAHVLRRLSIGLDVLERCQQFGCDCWRYADEARIVKESEAKQMGGGPREQ